jgi:tetratricopeptide (TPR) repeat protein
MHRRFSPAPGGALSKGAVGLALVCAAFLGCQEGGGKRPSFHSEYPQQRRLIDLLGPARRTRPRFAGFERGPCRYAVGRSPVEWSMQCAEAPRLKPAAIRALEDLRRSITQQTPSAEHVLGVRKAHLATSTSGLYDALLDLRHATAANSAAAWNDLGAAHLLMYEKTASADELASGLESFERALDLNPREEEARFNHALALQVLGLHPAAMREWRSLLQADPEGPWAAEVAGYLDALSHAPTTGRPPPAGVRTRGEGLLADWARLGGKGSEAERKLDQAVSLGEELAAEAGDRLLLDSARFAQATRGTIRTRVVQAHLGLADARGSNDYASCAGPTLSDAVRRFTQAGSPFGVWARVDQTVCDFFAKDFTTARRRLQDLLRAMPPGYRIARARASWILGLVELRAGRLPVALSELREAEAGYAATHERAYASYLESLIARTLRHMGWRKEGWIARGRALESLWELDPERRYNVLEEIIETLNEEGRFHAARAFLDAQFAAAREASGQRGVSDLPVFAALNGWEIAWTAGDAGRARQALEQAILSLREVAPDSENRKRLNLEVALASSWMQGGGDEDSALQALLAFYARHGEGEQLDALKHLQLRVAMDLAHGERRNLRSHLELALRRAEEIAGWAADPVQQRSLERRRRWLSSRLVELESASDAQRGLLAVVRARESRPGALPSQDAQKTLAEIRSALPRGAAVLVTFPVEQGTFGWLLGENTLQSWRSPVGTFELVQLSAALRSAASSGDEETFRRTSERLGKVLLPPQGWGHTGTELFVVTDDVTAEIPFAALLDPGTGRPLLDDHAVVLQTQMERLSAAWRNPPMIPLDSVAVIAAPDLDPGAFPALAPLDFARDEGERIAGLYPRAEKWIGGSVSLDMLKAAFHHAPVVHLATHARGPREGSETGLVLGTEGDGILGAADVQRLGLRAPIVVLAACRSAAVEAEDPGSSSMAQAFLDAGSGSVVASLWPVDDRQSSILFLRFHQELLQGKNPAQALRAAQLALRQQLGPSSLETWSAFQVFVGPESPNRMWVQR